MTEALKTHQPNNVCKQDIDTLNQLQQIFQQAVTNNKEVTIKTTSPRPTPRVATTLNNTPQIAEKNKLLNSAITQIQTREKEKGTIFHKEPEETSSPRMLNTEMLVVTYPQVGATSGCCARKPTRPMYHSRQRTNRPTPQKTQTKISNATQ